MLKSKITNIVLKSLLFGLLLFGIVNIGFTQGGGAGSSGFSASVAINATATVVESIEIATIQNISIGSVTPGVIELFVNPQVTEDAGKLQVSGRPNAMIRINYLAQRELVRVGGSETLLFIYIISGNGVDNQFTSEVVDQSRSDVRLGPDGTYFIWIGGRVDLSEVVFGNYEGEFAIEIEYI